MRSAFLTGLPSPLFSYSLQGILSLQAVARDHAMAAPGSQLSSFPFEDSKNRLAVMDRIGMADLGQRA